MNCTPPFRHTLSASSSSGSRPLSISLSEGVGEICGIGKPSSSLSSSVRGMSGAMRREGPETPSHLSRCFLGVEPLTLCLFFLPVGSLRMSTGWRSPYTLSGFAGTFRVLPDLLGPRGGEGGLVLFSAGGDGSALRSGEGDLSGGDGLLLGPRCSGECSPGGGEGCLDGGCSSLWRSFPFRV